MAALLQHLVIAPFLESEMSAEKQKEREENREMLAARRKTAESEQTLMEQKVARVVRSEEAIDGLIIVRALYGQLVSRTADAGRGEPSGAPLAACYRAV